MGVKSTVKLTRSEALNRIVDLKLSDVREQIRRGLSAESNTFLEDELERLNDEVNGGEGFENYMISDAATTSPEA